MFDIFRRYLAALGMRISALAGQEYVGMSPKEWFAMASAGTMTDAGIFVDPEVAKKASAVFACMRILGGTGGSLPCQIFKRLLDGGRELDTSLSLYRTLHEQPNPLYSAFTYWQAVIQHIHFYGNSYTWLLRKGNGEVENLFLLDPRGVITKRIGMRWGYEVTLVDNQKKIIDQKDILDFPNTFFDMKTGRGTSTISAGAQAIGLSLATEAHSARFFANAAEPSMIVKYPKLVTQDMKEEIRKYIVEKSGGQMAHSPLVLSQGAEVSVLTMKAVDAQLLQSRVFQVEDIARLFGLPPWMIGSTEKTTSWGAGVEQMGIAFVVYALRSQLTMMEQELDRKLFPARTHFAEFNVSGLLRGDIKSRYAAYRIALGGNQLPGFMDIDEIRKLENLEPRGQNKIYEPSQGETTGSTNGQSEQTVETAAQ